MHPTPDFFSIPVPSVPDDLPLDQFAGAAAWYGPELKQHAAAWQVSFGEKQIAVLRDGIASALAECVTRLVGIGSGTARSKRVGLRRHRPSALPRGS